MIFMNTSNAVQTTSTTPNLKQWMREHAMFSFFFLAYAISWIFSIPVVLSEWNVLPKAIFLPFFIIKSFGPFAAAYIMVHILEGKEGWLDVCR
jgi:hypothetical protein